MPYGIKAYGTLHSFGDEQSYREYLMEWIVNTDGSERYRAVRALANLDCGVNITDTDTI